MPIYCYTVIIKNSRFYMFEVFYSFCIQQDSSNLFGSDSHYLISRKFNPTRNLRSKLFVCQIKGLGLFANLMLECLGVLNYLIQKISNNLYLRALSVLSGTFVQFHAFYILLYLQF